MGEHEEKEDVRALCVADVQMLALSLVGDICVDFLRATELLADVGNALPGWHLRVPCSSCSDSPLHIAPHPGGTSGLHPAYRLAGWGGGNGVLSQFCYPSARPAGVVWLTSSELTDGIFSFGASAMTSGH